MNTQLDSPLLDGTDPVSRRSFLTLMGASMALAGVAGCSRHPDEQIVPYVHPPLDETPGKPLFYATAFPLHGYARGVLARANMHRPTKLEGNPDHPSSLGATDATTQASLLQLYDPDRSQTVTNLGVPDTWDGFTQAGLAMMAAQRPTRGAGLRILTGTVTSPTLAWQLDTLLAQLPGARWHIHEPLGLTNTRAGAQAAFGRPLNVVYHFNRADCIVALDSDFLLELPGSVRYAREFADRRRVRTKPVSAAQPARADMSRLYAIEGAFTLTGAMADHRWPVKPSEVEGVARALASRVGAAAAPPAPNNGGASGVAIPDGALDAIARDLVAHRGRCAVVAGEAQPPAVHALAHAMNRALGAFGSTVTFTEPVEAGPKGGAAGTLAELVADMDAGRAQALLILGGNPAYTSPSDVDFSAALQRFAARPGAFSAHLSMYQDETSTLCQWHVPETHYLETWSDARAHDGTVTIMQPLIAPLFEGHSAHEALAALMRVPAPSGHDVVRGYWQAQRKLKPGPAFDAFWQKSLNDGVVPGTTAAAVAPPAPNNGGAAPPRPPILGGASAVAGAPPNTQHPTPNTQAPNTEHRTPNTGLELAFRPDPYLRDGQFANNGWLQELPRPLTHLTWDNAALVSPATAQRLGLLGAGATAEDIAIAHDLGGKPVVELRYRGRSVRAPVWVLPGQPDDTVTVHLGYGRTSAGNVGNGAGFDAYRLRTSDAPGFGTGLEVVKTGESYVLAGAHNHHQMDGRDLVREASLVEFQQKPEFAHATEEERAPAPAISLYPGYDYKDQPYEWGMSIDTTVCIGCHACTQACQAENNIPIVGKQQVLNSREMHWIRIDSYHLGTPEAPRVAFLPVPCMHCENAPCELVCPVGATVHSKDGLNQMVYNRCVGTRYCSNNCPYKVRRFNFLQWVNGYEQMAPTVQLMRNPEVTVRTRGVMEKCTYCIQRIEAARIEAEKADRAIADSEVVPACAQACPTQAIVFGNINDPNGAVTRLKAEPLNYGLLTELNTRPRTTYLAKLRNPNAETV